MLADDVLQAAVEEVVRLEALLEGQELVLQVRRCATQSVGRPPQVLVDQVACEGTVGISGAFTRHRGDRGDSPRTRRATSECKTIESMAGFSGNERHTSIRESAKQANAARCLLR